MGFVLGALRSFRGLMRRNLLFSPVCIGRCLLALFLQLAFVLSALIGGLLLLTQMLGTPLLFVLLLFALLCLRIRLWRRWHRGRHGRRCSLGRRSTGGIRRCRRHRLVDDDRRLDRELLRRRLWDAIAPPTPSQQADNRSVKQDR